jgi:NAD-dependent SIR2 family protein deacetylase
MSGVIDSKGRQWEHCNVCGKLVMMEDLGYVKPSKTHQHGQDICVTCVDAAIRAGRVRFGQIVPAKNWKRAKIAR